MVNRILTSADRIKNPIIRIGSALSILLFQFWVSDAAEVNKNAKKTLNLMEDLASFVYLFFFGLCFLLLFLSGLLLVGMSWFCIGLIRYVSSIPSLGCIGIVR